MTQTSEILLFIILSYWKFVIDNVMSLDRDGGKGSIVVLFELLESKGESPVKIAHKQISMFLEL